MSVTYQFQSMFWNILPRSSSMTVVFKWAFTCMDRQTLLDAFSLCEKRFSSLICLVVALRWVMLMVHSQYPVSRLHAENMSCTVHGSTSVETNRKSVQFEQVSCFSNSDSSVFSGTFNAKRLQ